STGIGASWRPNSAVRAKNCAVPSGSCVPWPISKTPTEPPAGSRPAGEICCAVTSSGRSSRRLRDDAGFGKTALGQCILSRREIKPRLVGQQNLRIAQRSGRWLLVQFDRDHLWESFQRFLHRREATVLAMHVVDPQGQRA